MATMLDVERQTFERERANLMARAPGKFVLIKGTSVIGVFDTEEAAIAAGYQQLGHVAFFVHKIEAVDTPINFTTDIIGR